MATPHRQIIFLVFRGYFVKIEKQNSQFNKIRQWLFESDILDYLENKPMDYVVAAKFSHPIQRIIV